MDIELCMIAEVTGGCHKCESLTYYDEEKHECKSITNALLCFYSSGFSNTCEKCLSGLMKLDGRLCYHVGNY